MHRKGILNVSADDELLREWGGILVPESQLAVLVPPPHVNIPRKRDGHAVIPARAEAAHTALQRDGRKQHRTILLQQPSATLARNPRCGTYAPAWTVVSRVSGMPRTARGWVDGKKSFAISWPSWPSRLLPHAITWPVSVTASECIAPAAMLVSLQTAGGAGLTSTGQYR